MGEGGGVCMCVSVAKIDINMRKLEPVAVLPVKMTQQDLK